MEILDDDWIKLVDLAQQVYRKFGLNKGKSNIANELMDFVDELESKNYQEPSWAVVTCGRFQPPHLGHQKIFKTMENQAGFKYVFTTESYDKDKNPIPLEEKVRLLQEIYPVPVVVAKNFIDMLVQVNEQFQNIKIVLGDDHLDFEELAYRYNGQPDKQGNILYHFNQINFIFLERDSISGTKVREYVRNKKPLAGLVDPKYQQEVKKLLI